MPTKTMLRAPELVAESHSSFGAVVGAELDVSRVFAWRDAVAERDDSSQVEWLASQNAQLLRGDAVVERPGALRVNSDELKHDKQIAATGSPPAIPPDEGPA